jgi:NAD(P)H-dependent FMN reductase
MSNPSKPKIGIIISTTRKARFGGRAADWVLSIANARGDADYELVDLRDYTIPLFEADMSPRWAPVTDDGAKRWAAKVADLDGYVFITAEYNHSISAVLKNALDHLATEGARKPAAFVGYGTVGAARAIEQLRLIAVEVSMLPTQAAVHINMEPFKAMLMEGKDFADFDYLAPTVTTMLNELTWYARTLKAGRDAEIVERAAA